jgi:glycosyltransferase involved in cell wall biosynthesis
MLKSIIIIDDYAFINGGAASVAIRSACSLADTTKYNIYYFSAVGPISDELKNSKLKEIICLKQYDILHHPNKVKAFIQGIWNTKSRRELACFLDKFDSNTTIVHIHTWSKSLSSSIFGILERKKIQVAVTLHDYFISCPNGTYFNYRKSKHCILNPMSVKCILCNCDSRHYHFKIWRVIRQFVQNKNILNRKNITYVYISEFSIQQIQKRLKKIDKLVFVNNPVDFTGRIKINAECNDIYLYIGRLSEEKGIRMFCEVVTFLNLKAIIIGDGPLRNELELRYNNKILFTGWLSKDQMQKYFKKARCLIFTSLWYETLGLTVLEALSLGIPCLVPDNSATADLVKDNVNGIIYKSGDKQSLITAINKIIDDATLVENLSWKAYANFDELHYSIKTHINNLILLYNSILNENNQHFKR